MVRIMDSNFSRLSDSQNERPGQKMSVQGPRVWKGLVKAVNSFGLVFHHYKAQELRSANVSNLHDVCSWGRTCTYSVSFTA